VGKDMIKIFAISGSASEASVNEKILDHLASIIGNEYSIEIFTALKSIPHFNPEESLNNPPLPVLEFRNKILAANGIIICSPEYVFSIPAGLKNAIEWCVATTVFTDKPVGIITASSSGVKGHEELKMIMGTLGAKITDEASLLIGGVKARINEDGKIKDAATADMLNNFISSFQLSLR
jgi:chromate reductase